MGASFDLAGRVALVTGGSRGIGRAIAQGLAAHGAAVAVNARGVQDCDRVAAEISAAGGHAIAVRGNVGHADDCERAVTATMEQLGRLDILVNNAATNPQFGPLLDAEEAALDKIWSVNLKAPWRLTSLAVTAWMGNNGGSVINISSIGGVHPEPLIAAYNASKAALINMTKSLAKELGPRHIRVNAIAPGLIRTDFSRVLVETPEIRERLTDATALHRVGEPEEIAGAAVFLASEASSFVTGAVLMVDGGI
ncbi:MAG: SDR family oxidoreductase [Candidatus Dormibacteria bacterium]